MGEHENAARSQFEAMRAKVMQSQKQGGSEGVNATSMSNGLVKSKSDPAGLVYKAATATPSERVKGKEGVGKGA